MASPISSHPLIMAAQERLAQAITANNQAIYKIFESSHPTGVIAECDATSAEITKAYIMLNEAQKTVMAMNASALATEMNYSPISRVARILQVGHFNVGTVVFDEALPGTPFAEMSSPDYDLEEDVSSVQGSSSGYDADLSDSPSSDSSFRSITATQSRSCLTPPHQ